MRIDAHQHFWRVSRGDYGWITPEATPTLNRDFAPTDLEPLLRAGGIDKTVLVQAAETAAETDFLLKLADGAPFIAAVIGWVDLEGPYAAQEIAQRAKHPKIKGLRPVMQDMEDKAWMLRDTLTPAFDAMIAHGLRFDALIKPPHLAHLGAFLDKYPALPVVIDHAAKPDIASRVTEPWATQMRTLGKTHPHLYCKLSGLATEAGEHWYAEKLRPYVDVLLEAFGPARLMFGSDWPVLTLAGSYARWLDAAETLTAHLSSEERARIFGGTAADFYGLADA